MKKMLFAILFFAFGSIGFGQVFKSKGDKYTNIPVTNIQIIQILRFGDTNGLLKVTPKRWADDFVFSYNTYTAPRTGTYIRDTATLFLVLGRLTPQAMKWNGNATASDVHSTGWLADGTVSDFPRESYDGETPYCDQGYPVFSNLCGNPLRPQPTFVPQQYGISTTYGSGTTTTSTSSSTAFQIPAGTTLYLSINNNSYGGSISNSANNLTTNNGATPAPGLTTVPSLATTNGTTTTTSTTGYTGNQNTGYTGNTTGCINCTGMYDKKIYQATTATAVGSFVGPLLAEGAHQLFGRLFPMPVTINGTTTSSTGFNGSTWTPNPFQN